MTSLAADLSRVVGDAFAAEGLDRALRPGHALRPARSGAVPVQWRAGGGERSQGQSPRHRRENRRPAEKPIRNSPRSKSPVPASSISISPMRRLSRASPDADARARSGEGKTLVIDFGGPNVAKPMACGSSSFLHHRRLPAAPVPRQWLACDQRCPSGRLGPADGPADFAKSSIAGHRADLFRRRRSRSVPGAISGDHGRSGRDLSGGLRRLQSRSGAAGSGAPRHGGIAGWPPGYRALWRHFVDVTEAGAQARIRQPGRAFRSVERRIQCP